MSLRCRRIGRTTARSSRRSRDKYGIKVNSAQPDAASQDEINAANQQKGKSSAPDVFDLGQSVALANTSMFAPYKVATFDDIPAAFKDRRRHLGQRLRRLHVDRLRLGQGAAGHERQRPAQARVPGQGRAQRRPDPGRRGVLRRPDGGAVPGRLGRRHRARRRVLPQAQGGGQLPAGRPDAGDHRVRPDAGGDRLELPQRQRDQEAADLAGGRAAGATPSPATTTRRSTRTRRIPRRPGCGRSSSTATKGRTCTPVGGVRPVRADDDDRRRARSTRRSPRRCRSSTDR